ncbi:50S ribosomal protein L37ae [Candidatus Woesearchaeota archaeon]|nr:50S ribosomal protein L37ae [Candidatus Woesearchaeota archaeon]
MATLTKYGSTKRFGPRYGRRVKEKFGKIEKERNESSTCPQCRKTRMKRLASGIWSCKKCNIKMAGGAYIIRKIATEAKESE